MNHNVDMFIPILIFLLIALLLTIIVVRFNKYTCPGNVSEAFQDGANALADVKTCPYGSVQYIDEKDNVLCCDGKVEGRSCLGADLCRFSPGVVGGKSVPHCTDYVASQSFKPSSSMIQNPATDTCLTPGSIVSMSKCDSGSNVQLWTYNSLGQVVNDATGKCLTLDISQPGIKLYTMKDCQLSDAQLFKYDYKKNQLFNGTRPLYVQDFSMGKDEKFIIGSMSDDEIKAEYKKRTGRSMSPGEFTQIKAMLYSDSDKPDRGTLISIKPTFQETLKNITSMFKQT